MSWFPEIFVFCIIVAIFAIAKAAETDQIFEFLCIGAHVRLELSRAFSYSEYFSICISCRSIKHYKYYVSRDLFCNITARLSSISETK